MISFAYSLRTAYAVFSIGRLSFILLSADTTKEAAANGQPVSPSGLLRFNWPLGAPGLNTDCPKMGRGWPWP